MTCNRVPRNSPTVQLPCRATSGCWWWRWHTENTRSVVILKRTCNPGWDGQTRHCDDMTSLHQHSNSCILPGITKGLFIEKNKNKKKTADGAAVNKVFWCILESYPRLWSTSFCFSFSETAMTPSLLHALKAQQHKQHARCLFPVCQVHLEERQLKKTTTMLDYDSDSVEDVQCNNKNITLC